ncbi:MAG: hypothetical protein ACPHID_03100 [Thermoplasmatota archaeon]
MRAWTLFLLTALLAGCAETTEPTTPEPQVILDEDRPATSYGEVSTGPAVEPDWNATTAAAPQLVPGEWWRIRYHEMLTGDDVEVVRVVAAVDEAGYVFGMPHEGWLKEAISFHAPAFGDVNFDLSYNTHNQLFQPVRFPLVLGDTWETSMAAQPYEAQVTQVDDFTATIDFTSINANPSPADPVLVALGILPGDTTMRLVYDARQHEIVRMESALGVWEVIEHGYDYEGWVTVPRGEDTAIDYGTFLTASDAHTPMERTLEVPDDFNRMTMMHFVGTLNEAPGYMQARDVTPAGDEHITELTGSGFQLSFYEVTDPGGTWTVQDTIVGAGFTYHMGIAYFQYDIHLPSGDRRADHGHAVIR